MPTGAQDVRIRGKTGRGHTTPKATRLTHNRHRAAKFMPVKNIQIPPTCQNGSLIQHWHGIGQDMRRRDFITFVSGAAVAWPLAARAQQGLNSRRIGVLMGLSRSDTEGQLRIKAFESAWPELGWIEGRNIK